MNRFRMPIVALVGVVLVLAQVAGISAAALSLSVPLTAIGVLMATLATPRDDLEDLAEIDLEL